MIDLHTHALPHIDDGAESTRTAIEILQMELEQGVHEVVFTPHYYGKRSITQFLEARKKGLDAIQNSIPQGLKIRMGAEILLTGINDPTDETICSLAIEGTKYVLIELPFQKWSERLIDRMNDFIAETGYTPIIAHVERYVEVLKNPSVLTYLIEQGCLIQVNTTTFLDKRLKGFAFALLKKGMVHCLGTDAHNTTTRTVDYAEAKNAIFKKGMDAEWNNVQWCMQQILKGESILLPTARLRKFLFWYF